MCHHRARTAGEPGEQVCFARWQSAGGLGLTCRGEEPLPPGPRDPGDERCRCPGRSARSRAQSMGAASPRVLPVAPVSPPSLPPQTVPPALSSLRADRCRARQVPLAAARASRFTHAGRVPGSASSQAAPHPLLQVARLPQGCPEVRAGCWASPPAGDPRMPRCERTRPSPCPTSPVPNDRKPRGSNSTRVPWGPKAGSWERVSKGLKSRRQRVGSSPRAQGQMSSCLSWLWVLLAFLGSRPHPPPPVTPASASLRTLFLQKLKL